MSKVLCLVLSFIIGASAYQTLEAAARANMLIQNRENAIAALQHNEPESIHMEHGSKGKKGQGNGLDSGQTFDSNLNLLNNASYRLNAINRINTQDERTNPNSIYNKSLLPDGVKSPEIGEDNSKRGHLDAEIALFNNTSDTWDKIKTDPFNDDPQSRLESVVKSNDMRLIGHFVDSIMSSDIKENINKKTVSLPDEVTHLFPGKSKVTLEELMNKHDQLKESYLAASGIGGANGTEAKKLKEQMEKLSALAGQLVQSVDKEPMVDPVKMQEKIDEDNEHAKDINNIGPERNWEALSAKDQMLLQSKHLQETFNAGLESKDVERYAASKEILDRAVALNDYDSLKLIRENTKDSGGAFGTGVGATEHSKKILEHKVKDEKGNEIKDTNGKTLTIKDLEEKIEALREEAKNDNFNTNKQEELDRYVALYGKALNEYAEKHQSGGLWWTQIPKEEFEGAEHQYDHNAIPRPENVLAAHYNNKTNANASGETSSNN